MLGFFKKASVFKVFSKKRLFLLCALAVFVLLIFPLRPALALAWWNPITWISSIIGAILKLILKLSELTLQLANWFLSVALSNPFGVSLTVPGDVPNNPIINIGWTLLRDITNMLFILGLAYIGLATALNITNFNTKKTFGNLLLIAVLINFTPVICGVLVDISNIISRFFTQGIDFSALEDVFSRQQGELMRSLGDFSMDNVMVMLKSVFLIGYGFIGAFILLIYTSLFFIRAPIIWLLVIFSPLAFFAWIFDQTRTYFKQWWNIFLQWTIIVIPSAFFLYLSQQVLVNSADLVNIPESGLMGKFLSNIAPYSVALFFMIIGLIMSIKINAAGAQAVMKFGMKAGTSGLKTAGRVTKQGSKGARNLWRSKVSGPEASSGGYQEWAQEHKVRAGFRKAGRYMFGGETDPERAKWKESKGGRAVRWTARGAGSVLAAGAPLWGRKVSRKIGTAAEESTKKEMAAATEKYSGKTLAGKKEALRSSGPGFLGRTQRIGALMAAIKDGDDISDLGLNEWEIKRIMQDAIKADPSKISTFKQINPFVTAEAVKSLNISDAHKRQAGIYVSDDDKQKYKQQFSEDDEVIKAMSEKQREAALMVDKKTGKVVEINGKKQYKINYTETVNQDDEAVKKWTAEERARRLIKNEDGTAKLDDKGKEQYKKDIDPLTAKLIAEVKTAKMETWSEGLSKRVAGNDVVHDFWEGAQVSKAASLFSAKFINSFRDKMQENGREHYALKNPSLSNYFNTTPARSLGLDFEEALPGAEALEGAIKERANKEAEITAKKEAVAKTLDLKQRQVMQKELDVLNRELKQLEKREGDITRAATKKAMAEAVTQERFKAEEAKREGPDTFLQSIRRTFPAATSLTDTTAKQKTKRGFQATPLTEAPPRTGKTTTRKAGRPKKTDTDKDISTRQKKKQGRKKNIRDNSGSLT